jgi:hypothetical protein
MMPTERLPSALRSCAHWASATHAAAIFRDRRLAAVSRMCDSRSIWLVPRGHVRLRHKPRRSATSPGVVMPCRIFSIPSARRSRIPEVSGEARLSAALERFSSMIRGVTGMVVPASAKPAIGCGCCASASARPNLAGLELKPCARNTNIRRDNRLCRRLHGVVAAFVRAWVSCPHWTCV